LHVSSGIDVKAGNLTTSGLLRFKLGEALEKRGVAAHIFESAEEAQSDWRNVEGTAPAA
jgi:propionate CoA-transferase